jgi:hypothetical protein
MWSVRYLIVAHHETDEEHQAVMKGLAPPEMGHEAIAEKTSELIAEDPDAQFHLLMLATPPPGEAVGVDSGGGSRTGPEAARLRAAVL